jgi:hypothetical protein
MDGNDKAAMGSGRATILCFTSNGIGMGHLARALAIARRLGPAFRPVVVTLSQAVAACSAFGIPAEHLPHHRYLGYDVQPWNASLTHSSACCSTATRPGSCCSTAPSPMPG